MQAKIPIKRAELIGNLVQSISVIPEAIVRDVYIKECAQLLRVEDKLLVSEVAKRRETAGMKSVPNRQNGNAESADRHGYESHRAAHAPEDVPMPNGRYSVTA